MNRNCLPPLFCESRGGAFGETLWQRKPVRGSPSNHVPPARYCLDKCSATPALTIISSRNALRPYTALNYGRLDIGLHQKASFTDSPSSSSWIQLSLTHRWRSARCWPTLAAFTGGCAHAAPANPARCGGVPCGRFSSCGADRNMPDNLLGSSVSIGLQLQR